MDRPLQKPWETPSSGALPLIASSQSGELHSESEQSNVLRQKIF